MVVSPTHLCLSRTHCRAALSQSRYRVEDVEQSLCCSGLLSLLLSSVVPYCGLLLSASSVAQLLARQASRHAKIFRKTIYTAKLFQRLFSQAQIQILVQLADH